MVGILCGPADCTGRQSFWTELTLLFALKNPLFCEVENSDEKGVIDCLESEVVGRESKALGLTGIEDGG